MKQKRERIQALTEKTGSIMMRVINYLAVALFLPILFCVLFIGSDMDYYAALKPVTIRSNFMLGAIAIVTISILVFVMLRFEKNEITKKWNWILNGILAVSFFLLYVLNCRVAKEIAFQLPWDIMMVQGYAAEFARGKDLGYHYYFSMYPNNIPIVYIMGKLLRYAMESGKYVVLPDYILFQLNCLCFSVAGFFSCLTVKKITKRVVPVFITFGACFILVILSAWKTAPYTDALGVIFPIIAIYLYISYLNTDRKCLKYVLLITALVVSGCGGFVKPNLYIITVAMIGMEGLRTYRSFHENIKYFLVGLLVAVGLLIGGKIALNYVIDEIGLEYNPVVSFDWHHYFLMGLNEETTGSYESGAVALVGKYQYDKEARIATEMNMAMERLKDRGVVGSITFWIKKLVMTFNEATFGWSNEVWIEGYYPAELASNTNMTVFLREIFWWGAYAGAYQTICQCVWIFVLIGIMGLAFVKKDNRHYTILSVCFLGIFLYQMLLEARARYLFAFLPLIICISSCGIWFFTEYIRNKRKILAVKDDVNK